MSEAKAVAEGAPAALEEVVIAADYPVALCGARFAQAAGQKKAHCVACARQCAKKEALEKDGVLRPAGLPRRRRLTKCAKSLGVQAEDG